MDNGMRCVRSYEQWRYRLPIFCGKDGINTLISVPSSLLSVPVYAVAISIVIALHAHL